MEQITLKLIDMKQHEMNLLPRHEYVVPSLTTLDVETSQVLCGSWNDGSISDTDDDWNIIESL